VPSRFFWPFPKELKMAALAALQSITLDEEGFVSCAKRAMSMPLEAVAATLRANDRLATSLKLTWAEGLFHCCFYSAFNCCDGLVHNCVEVPNYSITRKEFLVIAYCWTNWEIIPSFISIPY
jgi:hypothetical protein